MVRLDGYGSLWMGSHLSCYESWSTGVRAEKRDSLDTFMRFESKEKLCCAPCPVRTQGTCAGLS